MMFTASVVVTVLMILTAWLAYQIRFVWLCVPAFVAWFMLWGYVCLVMTVLYFAPANGLLYYFLALLPCSFRCREPGRQGFAAIPHILGA
jgi:hypothetical protein